MSESRSWRGWGVQIQVDGPAALLEGLAYQVPPCGVFCHPVDSPTVRFEWDALRHFWVRYPDEECVLDLESALALEVATHSPQCLFVHAGTVRYRGRALVIPGVSRAGKSTLVEALVRRGTTYYSDEYAVFHPDGRVLPYPRKLSLRATPERPQGLSRQPESLGWEPQMGPIPLGWILDCRYTGRHDLQSISPGESLLSLFANAVAARSRAKALFHSLSKALDGVSALRGVRAEADDAAAWIMDWLKA
ncbi:MAG: hypothetical protein KF760_26750 [Candidatus Eremiobacteraeota bacterium]|nr:hypothetical protein [Candidatus Eremiobacteraeota bacterium]MCW5868834.1 hypothetical protein [Candidatus Eremiobacteraeota bacterium]